MLTCQKRLFSLPNDLHYLNCAYMAPLPRPVEEAGIAGIRSKRVPSTIAPSDFFEAGDEARRLFANLVQADAASIALIPSVSYGIASIARNLSISPGGRIVLLEEQFPSNVYIWRRLAADHGAEVVHVGPGSAPTAEAEAGESRSAAWNRRLLERIDARTDVIALPHVHWTDGTKFDLEAVGARARDVGAALVVDATQSVGALPFDVRRVQPDALVCAGYKWLFGPYSIGLAYYADRHHGGVPLEENWIGRLRSEEFSRLVDYESRYQPGAVRFDVGERSNFILLPMLVAALKLVLRWDPAAIQSYCERLCRPLVRRADELGYATEAPPGRGHHLFGLRTPDAGRADALRDALRRRNVSVSVRGSAVRVAPNVYNDEHDVQALIDALEEAAAVKS